MVPGLTTSDAGIRVGVALGVTVDVCVRVAVGVAVDVCVRVAVGEAVWLGVAVGIAVNVSVALGITVWVSVAVAVLVAVLVCVAVAVAVGVSLGTARAIRVNEPPAFKVLDSPIAAIGIIPAWPGGTRMLRVNAPSRSVGIVTVESPSDTLTFSNAAKFLPETRVKTPAAAEVGSMVSAGAGTA
jgi:hypothetical protein